MNYNVMKYNANTVIYNYSNMHVCLYDNDDDV